MSRRLVIDIFQQIGSGGASTEYFFRFINLVKVRPFGLVV